MSKKKKDSKGSNEDKLTLAEAFLGFRFQLKAKAIEKFTHEIEVHEEINARYRERNEQLMKEQKEHIKVLLIKARELEKELESREIIHNEQVEQAMKEKLELIKQNKQQVKEMLYQINELEQEIRKVEEVKVYWLEYKNVGRFEHSKYINVRENELVEMAKNFSEMKDYFNRLLERAKEESDTLMNEQMDEKKALASQKAISYMGRDSCQEVRENDWLKKELNLYSLEFANIEQAVQKVEEENLDILGQLFDCQISDRNICRNLFETYTVGPEGHSSRVMEEDLAKLELRGQPSEIDDVDSNLPKPKNTTLLAVEKKVSSMQPYFKKEKTENDNEPQFQLGKSVSQNLTYLLQEDEKCFEYLECGALEQRLLYVKGRAMSFQVVKQPSSQGVRNQQAQSNEAEMGWPVTNAMLRSAIL
uniref:coiled-coil domain-containing protein 83 n=1 Tax=Pristiophorus japonicus TaxID=55135 RepID=UPI00398ECCF4